MAFTPITGQPVQYSTEDNALASGYYLKFYDVGTTNGYSVATDSTGTVTLAKVKLNDEGYPISNPLDNTTVFVPHVDQDYRIVLYKTEADADADNTANAAWNIDGLTQEVAPLADAADISTKGTTLQVQDDYDRSPLFVDGTDFTAGAGPHVITVPAGWTPSNSDMRFYKVASNGVVTTLTPTNSDSTTFTIADTLLSTDTVFIGDDTFRNQMDGDPADIRARLDVYTTGEIDSALATKQDVSESISGFTKTVAYYIDDDGDSQGGNVFNASAVATGGWYTIGPTGSGATYTWSALDALPSDSKFIDFDILHVSALGAASIREVYLRRNGSAATGGTSIPPNGTLTARLGGIAASSTRIDDTKMARATMNQSNNLIDIYISGSAASPLAFYFILRGFGV